MCLVHTPKAASTTDKPVEYLHNQYLDGYTIGGAANAGRNSLRIDLSSPTAAGVTPAPGAPARPVAAAPIPGAPANPTLPVRGNTPLNFGPGTVAPTVGGSLAGSVPNTRIR